MACNVTGDTRAGSSVSAMAGLTEIYLIIFKGEGRAVEIICETDTVNKVL